MKKIYEQFLKNEEIKNKKKATLDDNKVNKLIKIKQKMDEIDNLLKQQDIILNLLELKLFDILYKKSFKYAKERLKNENKKC